MAIGEGRGTRRLLGTGVGGLLLIFGVLTGLTATATPAGAATQVVTNCNDSGPGSLRQAILNANPGDTIQIGAMSTVACPQGAIQLLSPVQINQNLTIDGPGPDIPVEDSGASAFVVASGVNATISFLSVTNSGSSTTDGGAINNSGALTLDDDVVSGDTATNGGGIYSTGGSVSVNDSTVTSNTATDDGGGIWFSAQGSGLNLTNSTVSNNTAGTDGGGVWVDPTMDGGVESTFSTIAGNQAGGSGGGFSGGSTVVDYSAVSGNSASTSGGGIAVTGGSALQLTESTVASNTSALGGGVYADVSGTQPGTSAPASIGMIHATVALNTATTAGNSGGGIYLAVATVTGVEGSIFANNGAGGDCFGNLTDQGFNIADDSTCSFTGATSLNNTPAGLSSSGLQNNGGPTQTIALAPGSPAIGLDTNSADCQYTDQRGFTQSAPCDGGAYDSTGVPPAVTSPGVPQNFLAVASAVKTVLLTWEPPASDGGSPITSYLIQPSRQPIKKTSVSASTACSGGVCSVTITGINAGQITFTVEAINQVGSSPVASTSVKVWALAHVILPSQPHLDVTAGQPVSIQLIASSVDGSPLTFALSSLPTGLSLDPATGLISGTMIVPNLQHRMALGARSLFVTDALGGSSRTVTFGGVVSPSLTAPLQPFQRTQVNTPAVPYQFVAHDTVVGATLSYSATGLAPGLSIDPTTGIVSGTPTTPGPFRATVTVTDSVGQYITKYLSWAVTYH